MDEIDWASGSGLLTVSDPALVDAAFDRNEEHVGIAVVGLSLNCDDLDAIAPRIVRTIESKNRETRRLGFTAIGHAARRFRELNPRINEALHQYRNSTLAEVAIEDVLQYVPFPKLPNWLKLKSVTQSTRWHLFERWRS